MIEEDAIYDPISAVEYEIADYLERVLPDMGKPTVGFPEWESMSSRRHETYVTIHHITTPREYADAPTPVAWEAHPEDPTLVLVRMCTGSLEGQLELNLWAPYKATKAVNAERVRKALSPGSREGRRRPGLDLILSRYYGAIATIRPSTRNPVYVVTRPSEGIHNELWRLTYAMDTFDVVEQPIAVATSLVLE